MKLIQCPACGHSISRHAFGCPSCGHPLREKGPAGKRGTSWLALLLLIFGTLAAIEYIRPGSSMFKARALSDSISQSAGVTKQYEPEIASPVAVGDGKVQAGPLSCELLENWRCFYTDRYDLSKSRNELGDFLKLNEKVKRGELTRGEYNERIAMSSDRTFDPKENKYHEFVRVRLTNNSASPMDLPQVLIVDEAGATYERATEGSLAKQAFPMFERINPGASVEGILHFDCPSPNFGKMRVRFETQGGRGEVNIPKSED